jgi:hypothetical protein
MGDLPVESACVHLVLSDVCLWEGELCLPVVRCVCLLMFYVCLLYGVHALSLSMWFCLLVVCYVYMSFLCVSAVIYIAVCYLRVQSIFC